MEQEIERLRNSMKEQEERPQAIGTANGEVSQRGIRTISVQGHLLALPTCLLLVYAARGSTPVQPVHKYLSSVQRRQSLWYGP